MKAFNIIVKEEAKADIIEAYQWYEEKQNGLGDSFIDIIDEYLDAIRRNPIRFPLEFENMRKAVVKKFPFIIIFEIDDKDILIFSVFHTKQDLGKIKNR